MAGYTDDELLSIVPTDPDLEQYRDFIRNARRQARQDFIGAHVAMVEWSTKTVNEELSALNDEANRNVAAAAQRKENCRTRYAELDRIYSQLPSKGHEPSAVKAVAAAASKS